MVESKYWNEKKKFIYFGVSFNQTDGHDNYMSIKELATAYVMHGNLIFIYI